MEEQGYKKEEYIAGKLDEEKEAEEEEEEGEGEEEEEERKNWMKKKGNNGRRI